MKKPGYYLEQAERYRSGGFACLACVAFVGPVLGAALVRQLPMLAILSSVALVLLFAAGLALLAAARRKDQRAIEEEFFRAREVRAQVTGAYPATLTSPFRKR